MVKKVKKAEVVEAEFEEVEKEEEPKKVACGLLVALTVDGDVSIQLLGENQNLVTLDGLVKYAERYLDKTWEPRLEK